MQKLKYTVAAFLVLGGITSWGCSSDAKDIQAADKVNEGVGKSFAVTPRSRPAEKPAR